MGRPRRNIDARGCERRIHRTVGVESCQGGRAIRRARTLSPEEHRAFLSDRVAAGGSASFLQTQAWAAVKPEWKPESIGWIRGDEVVGAALVLYRQLPKVRRYLAYLPEGPVIDWEDVDLAAWLDPLAAHVRRLIRAGGWANIRIRCPVGCGSA